MKPKLYQYAACPFCNKVRTVLEYKNIPFETIEVHPLKKTEIEFSKDYRAVPIYIDSKGEQVNDSTPIMRHIEKEFPQNPVFRIAPEEAQREEKWVQWSERFVKGLPPALYDNFFNSLKAFGYITRAGKFNWFEKRMIKYSGALVMTMVAKKVAKRENIDDPDGFLRHMAGEWAEGLERRPFMGGEKPSAADLSVYGITRSVTGLRPEVVLRENKTFSEWLDRVREAVSATASSAAASV